jgi:hypothetical protein
VNGVELSRFRRRRHASSVPWGKAVVVYGVCATIKLDKNACVFLF